ncbi:MAG: glucokinase [Candidatus Eisenbacteria bacterium]|nr:glucokinase [Candidatus Eisenbacteria bacterium]
MILAGDIGGTKTELALYAPGSSDRTPALERQLASHDFASLEAAVVEFLSVAPDRRVSRAVFGIAGVVRGNRCETTNLPWHVDGVTLSNLLEGARVTLMNDLATTAAGIDVLDPADLDVLQVGVLARGARAVLAAGTGLGMVAVVRDGDRRVIVASEGGHADFAPRNATEDELCAWLRTRYGRASVEHVLSGHGLADIYRFLSDTHREEEPAGFGARFEAAPDPAALVSAAALDGSCERARAALEIFIGAYGSEAGNLALRVIATEGLYIGGGIAPRVRAAFHTPRFMAAMRKKPPMSDLLSIIPVSLILEPRTSLWGAAHLALAPEGNPS